MQETVVNLTVNQTEIALACLTLFLFGLAYSAVVRKLRQRDPEHGYTAVLVVFGVAVVCIVFTAITSLQTGAVLLALMAAASLPMIYEYTDHHLTIAEGRRRARGLENLMEAINDLPPQNGRVSVETNHRRRSH